MPRPLLVVLLPVSVLLLLVFAATPTSAKIGWNTKAKEHTFNKNSRGNINRIVDIDKDDLCQLRLYRVRSFQGRPYIISNNRRRLRGLEKSMQSTGN